MNLLASEITEKHIENRLCREVKKLNGIPYKFSSPQRRSVPDRLCVFGYGIIWFIECKRPGETPTKAQYKEMNRLIELGHKVTWVNTYKKINFIIQKIKLQITYRILL